MLGTWVRNAGWFDRRKETRIPAHTLEASYKTGGSRKRGLVRDLSATGAYLVLPERWHVGTSVHVLLRRKWHANTDRNRMVYLTAKVVRWGRSGVGLTFVPDHLDSQGWIYLTQNRGGHVGVSDLIVRLRIARALAFILQICPTAMMEVSRMVRSGVSNERVSRVIRIAHMAEEILLSRRTTARLRAHPKVVLRIFNEGSRVDEELTQRFWAGLLAAACTEDAPDEDLSLVDLLARLAPVHVRLLAGACDKAATRSSQPRARANREFSCTTSEIRQVAGMHDLYRIERELNHLSDLGLMERVVTPMPFVPLEGVNLNLTALGRKLCARFWGHALPFMYRPEDQPAMTSLDW